jgi:hypothetical protein
MFNLYTVPEAGAGQNLTPVTVSLKLICLPAEVRIIIARYFKIFDYWTNLSYPSYFYFVILSEQNILFEFQKVVILIDKMS